VVAVATACGSGHTPSPEETAALKRYGAIEASFQGIESKFRSLVATSPYCARPYSPPDDQYRSRMQDAVYAAMHDAGAIDVTIEVLCGSSEAIHAQFSDSFQQFMVDGTAARRPHGRRVSWGTAISAHYEMDSSQQRAVAVESFVEHPTGRIKVFATFPLDAAPR